MIKWFIVRIQVLCSSGRVPSLSHGADGKPRARGDDHGPAGSNDRSPPPGRAWTGHLRASASDSAPGRNLAARLSDAAGSPVSPAWGRAVTAAGRWSSSATCSLRLGRRHRGRSGSSARRSWPFHFWQPAPPPPVVDRAAGWRARRSTGCRACPWPAANPSPLDPVALAAQRLQSFHASSRRDGAQTLGRLGDPRAVPALVHALKYDSSKDVKIAAAQALGQIGGTDAEVVLERCIVYEKKEEVRDAAALALRRLRDRRDAMAASAASSRPESRLSPSASGSQASVPRLPSPSAPPASLGLHRFGTSRNPTSPRLSAGIGRWGHLRRGARSAPTAVTGQPELECSCSKRTSRRGLRPQGIEDQPAEQLGIEIRALGGHLLEVRGDRLDVRPCRRGGRGRPGRSRGGDVGEDLARAGGRSGMTAGRRRGREQEMVEHQHVEDAHAQRPPVGAVVGGEPVHGRRRSGAGPASQRPSATVPKPSTSWSPPLSIASQAARQPASPSPDRFDLELGREPLGERPPTSGPGSPRPAGGSAGSGGRGRSSDQHHHAEVGRVVGAARAARPRPGRRGYFSPVS